MSVLPPAEARPASFRGQLGGAGRMLGTFDVRRRAFAKGGICAPRGPRRGAGRKLQGRS